MSRSSPAFNSYNSGVFTLVMGAAPAALTSVQFLYLTTDTVGDWEGARDWGVSIGVGATEAAKLLDETGSNADYAMEKAAEICK